MSNVKNQMSNVNKVKLMSERTSGVPPIILYFIRPMVLYSRMILLSYDVLCITCWSKNAREKVVMTPSFFKISFPNGSLWSKLIRCITSWWNCVEIMIALWNEVKILNTKWLCWFWQWRWYLTKYYCPMHCGDGDHISFHIRIINPFTLWQFNILSHIMMPTTVDTVATYPNRLRSAPRSSVANM